MTEIARGDTALDGFCDEAGTVNVEMLRAKWSVEFAEAGDHTLVTTTVRYNSPEDVRKVIAMGMKGGTTSTLERLDELLITRNASTAL